MISTSYQQGVTDKLQDVLETKLISHPGVA